jgi:uncharacterized RDD family membrane protein YckC
LVYCHKCGKELPAESAFCPACGTPVAGRGPYSSVSMTSVQPGVVANLATTGDRAVAVIIDTVILTVVGLLFSLPLGLLGLFGLGIFPAFFFGSFTLLWWLIWLVYFSFFEGTSGQTLGKQAVGIRVVDEVSQRPPPIAQAFLRNILRIIDWLPFLYIIGLILVETQPNKKRLGDIVARTLVIKA